MAAVESLIATSALIVSVVIEARDFRPWQPAPEMDMQRRTGLLDLRVETVHVGTPDQGPQDSFELEIEQWARPGGRVVGHYGLWSNVPTGVGTGLTGFCDSKANDLREAMTDDHCRLLVETEAVAGDLAVALALQRSRAGLDEVVTRLRHVAAGAGDMLARWVWVWVRDDVVASPDAFSRLLEIAEDPASAPAFREALLLSAHEDMSFTDDFSDRHRARLARAMFRAALSPGPTDLRDNLLQTWLPNLVGAERDDGLSVDDVFATEPALLAAVRDVRDRSVGPASEGLDAWLAGGERP